MSVMNSRAPLAALALTLALAVLAPVSGAALSVVGGGLDLGHACSIADVGPGCSLAANFDVVPTGPTTGSIDFTEPGPGPIATNLTLTTGTLSGSFGVVTDIVFTNVSLLNTQTGMSLAPGSFVGFSDLRGTVSGTYELFDAGAASVGGPQAFALNNILFANVSCLAAGGNGQCGLTVGGANNLVLDVNGTDHVFELTFNVIVPEPATAALFALGLMGMGLRRRL